MDHPHVPAEHLRQLEEALLDSPERRDLRIALAEAYLHLGHHDEALNHARQVLIDWPNDPHALGVAAMACDLAGDTRSAAAYAALVRWSDDGTTAEDSADRLRHEGSVDVTIPIVSFGDLEGATDEKRRLHEVIVRPYRLRREPVAAPLPAGLLLYGPSGSAKSHLVHALAGELHLNLVKVNVAMSVDPWGSASPGGIRRAYRVAVEHSPSILFLEDLEAVAHRRLRFTPHGRDALDELIDVIDHNDPSRVLIVATTSAPWLVNPQLRGEGRFSRSLLVGPLDVHARTACLERLVRQRRLPVEADLDSLGARTEGCSSDDLAQLVSAAAEAALRESFAREQLVALSAEHFDRALGTTRRSATAWFDLAYNFAEFTDDSSEYDPLFDYIRRNVRRIA